MTLQDFVNRTLPRMEKPGDPKAPPIPTDEEQRLFAARLSIFGSPEMSEAFTKLVRAQVKFVTTVDVRAEVLEEAAAGRAVSAAEDQAATFKAVEEVRAHEVRPAVAAVLQLAHAELAERRLGIWARLRSPVWGAIRRPDRWVRAHMQRAAPSSGKGAAQ
jgi:hypothetical protein